LRSDFLSGLEKGEAVLAEMPEHNGRAIIVLGDVLQSATLEAATRTVLEF
jgi:hypothetical protein